MNCWSVRYCGLSESMTWSPRGSWQIGSRATLPSQFPTRQQPSPPGIRATCPNDAVVHATITTLPVVVVVVALLDEADEDVEEEGCCRKSSSQSSLVVLPFWKTGLHGRASVTVWAQFRVAIQNQCARAYNHTCTC